MARTLVPAAIAALLLAATPWGAMAHAELSSSAPAADAILETPPTEAVLTFDDELDPAASGFVVTDAVGAEVGRGTVDLDIAERNVIRGDLAIDGDGSFEVRWTAVAADGHVEEGAYTFMVGGGEAPDTALPGRMPAWPLGITLVVLAVAISARRGWTAGER
jgi:methionine-rich copper-binding protein CopC